MVVLNRVKFGCLVVEGELLVRLGDGGWNVRVGFRVTPHLLHRFGLRVDGQDDLSLCEGDSIHISKMGIFQSCL